jgi:malonyl-CoA O-methyltransferase
MLDKEQIRKNFSRSAREYEKHAVLQKSMADDLLSLLPDVDPKRIMDIGCGTGYLAGKLAERFPSAEIIGIDIAPGMIEVAEKRKRDNLFFRIDDGEEVKGKSEYGLVVSNASLQWMEAPKVFAGVAGSLKPGGIFAFTTFGPGTLRELKGCGFRVNDFPAMEELEKQLKQNFGNISLAARIVRQTFKSVRDLVYHLKELGAQATDQSNKVKFPSFKRQGEVIATFEQIFAIMYKL